MSSSNGRTDDPEVVDVIIIGAGPAGTTAAFTLAERGRSVLVLERRSLPRFHIGESQLTYSAAILEEMGLLEEARSQGYPTKRGAEFIFPNGDSRRTDFADQGPGRHPTTFQCERSHFDHFLARSAERVGARILQDAMVHDVIEDADGRVTGVRYERDGETRTALAPWVIDAGGRTSKIAQRYKTRRDIPWLRNTALYRHYEGVDERHNPGEEGDIQIGGHADGWLWAIPIWPDTLSIGAVMPREVLKAGVSRDAVFDEHLARAPRIVQRLTGARATAETRMESDFCYYSDRVTGAGWVLAGDAGAFIDPIFSGGAFLAMFTGRAAAQAIDRILDDPAAEGDCLDAYSSQYKTGYDGYTRLVSAYYESDYKLGAYLQAEGFSVDSDPSFARVLGGDFWTDVNPINRWLREQRRWDTFEPFEPWTECPIYPDLDAAERAEAAALS